MIVSNNLKKLDDQDVTGCGNNEAYNNGKHLDDNYEVADVQNHSNKNLGDMPIIFSPNNIENIDQIKQIIKGMSYNHYYQFMRNIT